MPSTNTTWTAVATVRQPVQPADTATAAFWLSMVSPSSCFVEKPARARVRPSCWFRSMTWLSPELDATATDAPAATTRVNAATERTYVRLRRFMSIRGLDIGLRGFYPEPAPP